jgi:hypothetical protein
MSRRKKCGINIRDFYLRQDISFFQDNAVVHAKMARYPRIVSIRHGCD